MKVRIKQLAFSIKKNENVKFDEDASDEIKFALKRFSINAKRGMFFVQEARASYNFEKSRK